MLASSLRQPEADVFGAAMLIEPPSCGVGGSALAGDAAAVERAGVDG